QLMKAILPSAKNAPRAGRSWVRVLQGPLRAPGHQMKLELPAGNGRKPIRVGKAPDGLDVAWYELDGHGEPGRNGGEPGALWLMITDKGDANGT
ncbi:MAG TPA: hypothetical protein VIU29_03485, partial [Candidatus Deferrimicrobiaceae bacterium]